MRNHYFKNLLSLAKLMLLLAPFVTMFRTLATRISHLINDAYLKETTFKCSSDDCAFILVHFVWCSCDYILGELNGIREKIGVSYKSVNIYASEKHFENYKLRIFRWIHCIEQRIEAALNNKFINFSTRYNNLE